MSEFRNINLTAQEDILWPYLSIEEHFQVVALLTLEPNYKRRFDYLTKNLQLDKPHKTSMILSGGNKRKLCTALTLLSKPKLAYYDEPTTGLDPVSRRNLLRLIKMSNSSVVFTTHRLDEAEYLCEKILIMKKGKTLF